MNAAQSIFLAQQIEHDDPQCTTQVRAHGDGCYSIVAVDRRTGLPFVVTGIEDWAERMRAGALLREWRNK